MRRILVDFARSRDYAKRAGAACQVTLDEAAGVPAQSGAGDFISGSALEVVAGELAKDEETRLTGNGADGTRQSR